MITIRDKVRKFFGDNRTITTAKNIFSIILLKFIGLFMGLLTVPITLRILNPSEYGVWLTINSILVWFSILDIGLANGLRNKVSESLASGNTNRNKIYISTCYAILTFISVVASLLFLVINQYLNWKSILNTSYDDIELTIVVVVLLFFVRFVLQTINVILQAYNKYSIPAFWELIANFIFLVYIYILDEITTPSLLNVSVGYSFIFICVLAIQNLYYFLTLFKTVRISIGSIDIKHSRELIKLSMNYLIIQLGGLILFSTNNVIISHYINPTQVSVYNVVYKYFNIATLGWALILTPYLTSFNDAYYSKDYDWVVKNIKRLSYLWIIVSLGVLMMCVCSSMVYHIWIGGKLTIPYKISIAMAVYTIIVSRVNLYGYFINAIGKMKVSALYGVFTILVNIPMLYIVLNYFNGGLFEIIIVNCIILIPNLFLTQFQYSRLITKKAKGIWLS